MEIVVERIVQVNKGCLRAFCSVRLSDGVKINSCRVIQQPGQAAWVSLPQNEWTSNEGERLYSPVVEVSRELQSEIQKSVLAAYAAQYDEVCCG